MNRTTVTGGTTKCSGAPNGVLCVQGSFPFLLVLLLWGTLPPVLSAQHSPKLGTALHDLYIGPAARLSYDILTASLRLPPDAPAEECGCLFRSAESLSYQFGLMTRINPAEMNRTVHADAARGILMIAPRLLFAVGSAKFTERDVPLSEADIIRLGTERAKIDYLLFNAAAPFEYHINFPGLYLAAGPDVMLMLRDNYSVTRSPDGYRAEGTFGEHSSTLFFSALLGIGFTVSPNEHSLLSLELSYRAPVFTDESDQGADWSLQSAALSIDYGFAL